MSKFQNGGMRGKGMVDNLFLLRGPLDHAKYLGKEVWVTFYDIEKCFDSLWLQDCTNSLWKNGIKDDILSLVYFLNTKANIVIKSPFGETNHSFAQVSSNKELFGDLFSTIVPLIEFLWNIMVIFLDQLK